MKDLELDIEDDVADLSVRERGLFDDALGIEEPEIDDLISTF